MQRGGQAELRIQPKSKIFSWRTFFNIIPSGKNLMSKGITRIGRCPIRNFDIESSVHSLIYYWWAKSFWNTFTWTGDFQSYSFNNTADWMWFCSRILSDEDFGMMIQGARRIWFHRNAVLSGKEMICPLFAASACRQDYEIWSTHRNKLVVTDSNEGDSWEAPDHEYIKVNVDGAWIGHEGLAGVGMCGRNEDGYVYFASAKCLNGLKSSLEAGLSLLFAMQFAEEEHLQKVIFETDCAELMSLIMQGLRNGYNHGNISACREFLERNKNWSITLVLREANKVADFLAKKALNLNWEWSSNAAIPIGISHLL